MVKSLPLKWAKFKNEGEHRALVRRYEVINSSSAYRMDMRVSLAVAHALPWKWEMTSQYNVFSPETTTRRLIRMVDGRTGWTEGHPENEHYISFFDVFSTSTQLCLHGLKQRFFHKHFVWRGEFINNAKYW